MKVILDNGHGIRTSGKRSPVQTDSSQLFEFEFNRDIVRKTSDLLRRDGIQFTILVPEIEDIPLYERCKRANLIAHSHPGSFVVSIHANAGGGTGWEIFTYPNHSESDLIAQIFAEEAKSEFPEKRMRFDYSDGDADKESKFYILRHTLCPAVLTENFFMDYQEDLDLIMSETGRRRIAAVHFRAIKKYIEIKRK